MKLRLALAGVIGVAALAPATAASASTCNPAYPLVCSAIYQACNATYATYKICSNIK